LLIFGRAANIIVIRLCRSVTGRNARQILSAYLVRAKNALVGGKGVLIGCFDVT
jgi:hypothetical protein